MNFASRGGKQNAAPYCARGNSCVFVRYRTSSRSLAALHWGDQTHMLQTKSMTGAKIPAPMHNSTQRERYRSNCSGFLVGVFVVAFWKPRPTERGCMTDAFSRESFVFKSSFPSFRFLSLRVPSAADRAYPLAGCKTDRFAGKAVGLPSRSADRSLCRRL